MINFIQIMTELQRGGEWLSRARSWMQSNVPRGDTLTWGSGEAVSIPFGKLEDLALQVAVAAVIEDRRKREGPGTPAGRFDHLMTELHKRFPHPNPIDSTKTYEQYFLEWLDERLKADDANLPRGWVLWNGEGQHPTGETRVFYRMRDGDACDDIGSPANILDWTHTPAKQDWEIVAYKVVD